MILGLNNHTLATLKEQIITWMIAKMKVSKAIITQPNEDNCARFLKTTLWDNEIFPEVAFSNLSNANKGSIDYKGLLKLGEPNKRPTSDGNQNTKRQKPNFASATPDYNSFSPIMTVQAPQGGTPQPGLGGKRRGEKDRCCNLVQ